AGGSRGGGSSEGRNENSNNATANVYVESGREQALQIPPELYEVLNTSTREAHETARKAIDSSKEFGELSLKMIQESRRAETERAVSPEMVELIAKVDAQGETIQFLSTLLAQALASKEEKIAQLQSPETSPDNVINIVNELSIDEGLIDQLGLIIHQSMGEFNQRLTDLESRAQSSGNTSPVVINNINEVRQVADQTLENVTKVINQPGPTSVDIRQRLQLTRPMPRVNSRDLNGRRRPSRVRTSELATESAPGPQPVAEGWADPLEKPAKGAKWWYVENAGGIYNSDMPKKGVEKGDA